MPKSIEQQQEDLKKAVYKPTDKKVFDVVAQDQEACKYCANNPQNGGSGICNCILGNQVMY